ncbi:MAG: hypothetical protein IKZ26_04085 [Peptococcaceae bacterium]|nr:hypothetical protein [Peptococcaceae bacterium]
MFNIHVLVALMFILGGIGLIAATFYVQKQEDKARMPGFYTTAEIIKIKPGKNKSELAVTFEFTKDFKIRQVTNQYPKAEAEHWITGRKNLIVYDEVQEKIYYNPMKESRKKQAIMIIAGFLVLLFGINWLYFAIMLF